MGLESDRPLEGLCVVELATGIAGPYAAKMLCDAGAEVIKVETSGSGTQGDPLRHTTGCGRVLEDGEDSALFRFLNASKRSIAVDFDDPADRALAFELASRADIVIESFGPGGLEARGLDFAALRAVRPELVLVSISAWGLEGPWAERPATEFTLQAVCGASIRRGLPERTPVATGGELGCFATGAFVGASALGAWVAARQSGVGQHLDASLLEGAATVLTTFWGLRGHWMKEPLGLAAEAPSIEPARDGWVGFCTYTGQQWHDFCALIERPELAEDERFLHGSHRFESRDFLQPLIHEWTKAHDVADIIERASLFRVPSAPILNAEGILDCEHFRERGVFVENPHGFRQPRVPYQLGAGALRPVGRAPALNEHGEQIRAEIAAMPAIGESDSQTQRGQEVGSSAATRPFEGLRIIDLTAFWAGPVVTGFFADLGADVVKIESIQRPDGMRFVGATGNQPLWEWSEVFHGVNPGKRSITLNLDTEEGKALLVRLLEDADVLAENASARVLDNFGLGYERLKQINPRLILLRMPAWGLDGPWRDRPGFAANIEQASGIAWRTGYADLPIVPSACDPIGGIHAAFGVMAALEMRRRTGVGQQVEASLIEPALNMAAQQTVEYDAYGEMLTRNENRGPAATPQGLYRCRAPRDDHDPEWLALAIENDAQWRGLCQVLGDPAWALDAALTDAAGRRAAEDEVDARLSAWAAERSAIDAEAALLVAGVPAAAAANAHYLTENPQIRSRGFFQTIEHPVTGPTPYSNLPVQFSGFGVGLHTLPPPTMGQHNEEVLGGELGLDAEEIEGLRARKIIGNMPDF